MLLPADDSDCRETAIITRGRGGTNMIRVRPTKGEQRTLIAPRRFDKVVLELPPLVTRYFGVDQIVSLEPNTLTPLSRSRSSSKGSTRDGTRKLDANRSHGAKPTEPYPPRHHGPRVEPKVRRSHKRSCP